MNVKARIRNHLKNIPGWRTRRKIVVIESDDWGSIRTPSAAALQALKNFGVRVEGCNYMQFDSLESAADLQALFAILQRHKDVNGQYVKVTANTIVANPDFKRIEAAGFQQYFYEPFVDTYKQYPNHSNSLDTFFSGIKKQVFRPQLHGREHINISRWMQDLQAGDAETMLAFRHGMTGISTTVSTTKRGSYQAALDGGKREVVYDHAAILSDAASIFQAVFGFSSASFIAPNYVWSEADERVLAALAVRYLQGGPLQRQSADFGDPVQTTRHHTGQKNQFGQLYLVRNASFEPALFPGRDNVDSCLRQISDAFLWGKPAIICSHRVNYVGMLNPSVAENGLRQLDELIRRITKKWPSVEFMFTDELGQLVFSNE